jgi:hypothetical protein
VRFVLEDSFDGQVERKAGSCVVHIETIMPRGKRIPGRVCQRVREPLDEHGLAGDIGSNPNSLTVFWNENITFPELFLRAQVKKNASPIISESVTELVFPDGQRRIERVMRRVGGIRRGERVQQCPRACCVRCRRDQVA